MKRSLTADRRNKLAQILLSNGSVKVGELAKLFQVSTETIRKDIIYLEKEGIAQKSHGGAMATNDLIERPISMKELENVEKKSLIAVKALELIPKNGVIIIDAGSTNYALAKLLTLENGLTIFTNSIPIVKLLSDTKNDVYSFGGSIRGSSLAIVGYWAINELNTITSDIAFLGTDGFKSTTGPCTASFSEAEFKKNVISRSRQVAVLTDSSKFNTAGLFKFGEWEDTDVLITDSNAPKSIVSKLKKQTEVLLV